METLLLFFFNSYDWHEVLWFTISSLFYFFQIQKTISKTESYCHIAFCDYVRNPAKKCIQKPREIILHEEKGRKYKRKKPRGYWVLEFLTLIERTKFSLA